MDAQLQAIWNSNRTKPQIGKGKEDAIVDRGKYQFLVGKLIHLLHSRPNISYLVSVVSQFMHSPREIHQEMVYKILCYVKATL